MNNYDYPIGADNSDAPWNQEDPQEREVEVLVSLTLSKSFRVTVNDYGVTDLSGCNFKKAVEEQVTLPQMAGDILKNVNEKDSTKEHLIKAMAEDLSDWNVDEYEVILEKI